tara:strand:- start:228 stop:386 length:159 start_codon:yes stop_codon:yes gene_type:complete
MTYQGKYKLYKNYELQVTTTDPLQAEIAARAGNYSMYYCQGHVETLIKTYED